MQENPSNEVEKHNNAVETDSNASLLEVAIEAAQAAGAVALQGFRTALQIQSKGGSDIVTQFDHAAEKVALATVRAHFPTHRFLAEESGASETAQGAESAFLWMIDPI